MEKATRAFDRRLPADDGGWYSLTSALPGMLASVMVSDLELRLFVLIGPGTTSAGVALATQLERETDAVFVGEATGSSPNFYATCKPAQLPSSDYYYRISRLRHVRSMRQDDRRWLAPDIAAPERIQDLLQGVDSALRVALAAPLKAPDSAIPPHLRWQRASQQAARP